MLKNQPRGCSAASFAVWPTGNSIDFKICLREKASGQKGGEARRWREKSGKLSRGGRRSMRRRKKWKMAGRRAREQLRKCAGHFSDASPRCSAVLDDNNEDAARVQWRSRSPRPLCASLRVRGIVPFSRSAQFPDVLSLFTRSKFVDASSAVINIDGTSEMKSRRGMHSRNKSGKYEDREYL